jgi:glucose/arabinose dehydrogenase
VLGVLLSCGAGATQLRRDIGRARRQRHRISGAHVQALGVAPSGPTFAAPNFTSEVLATLAPFTVVGMTWAPDGRLFVWQKNGIVRVIKQGVLLPTPFIDLSAKVNTFDDRGFWGLAFHPNFAANGYVYLTYVYEGGGNPNDQSAKTSRLTRVTANPSNPDVALPGSEVIVLGTIGTAPCSAQPAGADCIPADGGSHTLGSLQFAADGKLFVGNGDGSDGDALALRAQDINSYSGKILRINDDGTAPSDNPFYDGTNSIRSKVWLYGSGIPSVTTSTRPAATSTSARSAGTPGKRSIADNAAPTTDGLAMKVPACNRSSRALRSASSCLRRPSRHRSIPTIVSVGAAAIGGSFYTASLYPTEYRGNFFFADYVGNWIQRVVVDASGAPLSIQPFATNVAAP